MSRPGAKPGRLILKLVYAFLGRSLDDTLGHYLVVIDHPEGIDATGEAAKVYPDLIGSIAIV